MTRQRLGLGVLLIAHFLLSLAFSVVVPLGEAPDEADHWAYVMFLERERRLPVGPEFTQAKHPPLYHASAALFAALASPGFGQLDTRLFLRANPDITFDLEMARTGAYWLNSFIHTRYEEWPWRPGPLAFHVARLWSVLLSTVTTWGVFLMLHALFPQRPGVVWAGTAVVAFLPEFAFMGGVVSNDPAAACLATLALAGAARVFRAGRWRAGWWTPLALGLGVWAKVSVIAVAPAVALLAWWGRGLTGPRTVRAARRRAAGVALFLLPAGLLVLPLGWRNWRLYGDPLGLALVRQTVDLRTGPWTWADTRWLLSGWFVSFWGKFGSAGHIPFPPPIYWTLAALSVAATLGLLRAWRRIPPEEKRAVVALAVAAVGVAAAIGRYSLIALGTNQGRLLFPAIGPLIGLWTFGLLAGWSTGQGRRWAYGLGAAMAALAVFGLLGVVRPVYAPPPPAPSTEWAPYALAQPIEFGEIALVAARLEENPVLYWQALTPPTRDWRAVLRITAEDGTLVWEWKRSPGAGRWSTDHWPTGYVMRDPYLVRWPDWAQPGRYRVEVAVHELMGAAVMPYRAGKPAASPDHPLVVLGWLEHRPASKGEAPKLGTASAASDKAYPESKGAGNTWSKASSIRLQP